MKTLEQVITWLKTSHPNRVIIVEITEIQGTLSTLYLSNKPYTTSTTDSIAPNRFYDNCIVGGVEFNQSLSLNYKVSSGFGGLEIDNTDGSKDFWFDLVLVNRPINILIGDLNWARDDFYLIFDGLIADISSNDRSSVDLLLVDKLQRLNNPITEELMPSPNTTNDILVPLVFGECFNIDPIPVDNVVNTLEYQVHDGSIEDIIEVRDNGVPVNFTKNLANGKFTLNQSSYGQITCSVQGHKNVTYYDDIANTIKEIVKNYGPVDLRFEDSDIDLTNFSSFSSSNTEAIGVYIKNGDNILTICNKLAESIGSQIFMTTQGKLKIVQLAIPGTGTSYTITANDIEEKSINIVDKPEVIAATKLGYNKNWTIQKGTIAAGVPSNSVDLFEEEWLYELYVNSTTKTNYKLASDIDPEDTLLIAKADAESEVQRRNSLWSTTRYIYSMTCYAHMLPVELGDAITLENSRFGLSSGKTGIAIGIRRDWLNGRVSLEVLV